MRSLTYKTIKQSFMLRVSDEAALETLHAGLMISYHECGHGLSVEAHITLMNCIAIARLIGIKFGETIPEEESTPERSACRWAVVLLDRFADSPLIVD